MLASLLLTLVSGDLQAQPAPAREPSGPRDSIDVVSRREGDSVVLRWTPMSPELWLRGQQSGYHVRSSGGRSTVIVPFAETRWRELARTNAVAASILKVLFDTASTSNDGAGDERMQFEMTIAEARYGAAMLMAASDPAIAEGLGLRWVDRGVPPIDLEYCVELAAPSKPMCIRVGPGHAAPIPVPRQLEAARDDRGVFLSWTVDTDPELLGFVVDRVDASTGTSERLTRAPLLVAELSEADQVQRGMFRDTAVKLGRTYRYEVRAINGFGQLGLPATTRIDHRAETPLPSPPELMLRQRGQCELEIRWISIPGFDHGACVRIERSRTLFEGYEPVATVCGGSSPFVLDSTASRKYSYYRCVVVDASGRELTSRGTHFTFTDSMPPTPPLALRGTIDDIGAVRLDWASPPECDVRGYHVFWSNDPEHKFVPRTRALLASTEFFDTVNIETLTRRVFYRVVAVDYTGLSSQWSDMLELVRPDHLRPLPPVLLEARPEPSGVRIKWVPSQSTDVAWQIVMRGEGSGRMIPLLTLEANATSAFDSGCAPGRQYAYSIVAEDSAANRSPNSGTLEARVPEFVARPDIVGLTGNYVPERKAVRLSWTTTGRTSPSDWIIVLRARPGETLAPLTSTVVTQNEYVDMDLTIPGQYSYALQIASGQWRSEITEQTSVVVP